MTSSKAAPEVSLVRTLVLSLPIVITTEAYEEMTIPEETSAELPVGAVPNRLSIVQTTRQLLVGTEPVALQAAYKTAEQLRNAKTQGTYRGFMVSVASSVLRIMMAIQFLGASTREPFLFFSQMTHSFPHQEGSSAPRLG